MHMNRLLKSLFFNLFRFGVVEDEGGGGGNAITPEVQAIIDAKISEAVTGLKTKNGELIAAQKQLKESLSHFEGIDPSAMKTMMKNFSDSEEAGLLAAGKLDEVVSKRVERMKTDYDKQLKGSADTIAQLNAKAAKLAAGKVSGALTQAASKLGALPEAMEDIVLRGNTAGFTVNDDGDVVAIRDGEIVLGKDGKSPLSVSEWAESLRDLAPHLWPKAQGAGAPGSNGGLRNGPDLSKLSPTERLTAARAGGKR